jgi:hypothetical protein
MRLERLVFHHADAGAFSVVISRNRRYGNTHAGLLYRDGGGLSVLHYAMHHHLPDDPLERFLDSFVDEDLVFVLPDLHDGVKRFLAGFCRRIARSRRNRTIPYAFQDDPEAVFALTTGDLTKLDDDRGLTCSTFVLRVFLSVGIQVIDRAGWPFTAEGEKIQRRIAHFLRREGWPEQADIIEAEADRNVPRVGPEHVAGALMEDSSDWPVTHIVCFPNAEAVLCMLAWPFPAT